MIHGGYKGVTVSCIGIAQTGTHRLVDREDVEIVGPCEIVVDDLNIEVSLKTEWASD